MRASLLAPAGLLALALALSACGDTGTSIDRDGANQEIAGTPCTQRGINIGEAGTTECTFENGVVLKFNDTDGVSVEGDPAQLPEECDLAQGAKWNNGQLQGGITCTWGSASIGYTPDDGLTVTPAA